MRHISHPCLAYRLEPSPQAFGSSGAHIGVGSALLRATVTLDVVEAEEIWVARERGRTPRTRAELAVLIDPTVLRDALKAP